MLTAENKGYDKGNAIRMPLPAETDRVIAIWKDILGHDTIGSYDDFFEIGGNSVRIVKLCSQINKIYGININISVLYQNCTVYSQAECIGKMCKKEV